SLVRTLHRAPSSKERSPRRQVAGSNPASRTIFKRAVAAATSRRFEPCIAHHLQKSGRHGDKSLVRTLHRAPSSKERAPLRQVAGSNPASRTIFKRAIATSTSR